MKHNIYLLAFILLISPSIVFAQNLDQKLAEIDAYAEKVRKDWQVPGMAIAIVKDDKVIFAKGYGVRKLGTNLKVNKDTLFAIASNSKSFTTASLSILIDEKKIGGWNDKVSKYLPRFKLYNPYVTSELTIRDLVSHRVGLGTFSGDMLWYETNYSNDEILRRLKYLKPTRGFRTGFGYQNLMFIAAGKVIENVSGKSWGEFVTERLLKPLKMNRTTTSIKDLKDNAAFPHNESGGNGLRVLHRGNVDGVAAAAGLNSSVSDMANWLRTQLNGGKFEGKQIFSARNAWTMHQPSVILPISRASSRFIPSKQFNTYGLGWNVWNYLGRKVVSHGGGLDGMISRTSMMPEEKLGLVVLTNSEQSVPTIMQYKIYDVFRNAKKRDWSAEYMGFRKRGEIQAAKAKKKVEAARKLNTKPTLALKDYVGTYSGKMYGEATIREENGKLVLRLKPAPNFVADLTHWHYDTFQIKWRPSVAYNFPQGFVVFHINKAGKVSEMEVDQPNRDFWFYELEFKKRK